MPSDTTEMHTTAMARMPTGTLTTKMIPVQTNGMKFCKLHAFIQT